MMYNPAFIVDGFTEKIIISKICPGKPVRRTDLNGKSVTLQAIANKIASLIRLLNNRYYPIIIVIDRENREDDIDTIINKLTDELKRNGLKDLDLRISVADRMLENWIIADWKLIDKLDNKPEITDGLNGSAIIKKQLGNYTKTTEGVELFLKADATIVYANSPSYRKFIDSLEGISCNYTQFDKEH